MPAYLLGQKKGPGKIRADYRIPFRGGHIQSQPAQRDTGIVDEQIDAAQCAENFGDRALDAGVRPHVQCHRHCACA
ncbi:hypothetical protein D3C83_88100 [compost metagenome]